MIRAAEEIFRRHKKSLNYVLISAIALSLDLTVYFVGVAYLKWEAILTSCVSYVAGLLLAYTLMVRHVFSDGWLSGVRMIEFLCFCSSGAVGAAVTGIVVKSMLMIFPEKFLIAKITAVGVSFFTVYIYRKKVVFR